MEDKTLYQYEEEEEELCTIEFDEIDCSENCHHIMEMGRYSHQLEEDIQRLKNINLKRENIYKMAINFYGIEHQILKTFEEFAELTKELCKYLDGEAPVGQQIRIAEEIADVEVMLDQLKIYFNTHDGVEKYKTYKVKRLRQNITKEYNHE